MEIELIRVLGYENHNLFCEYLCFCGNIFKTRKSDVKRCATKSCGCLNNKSRAERFTTHGLTNKNKRLYRIWCAMKIRCYNENHHSYIRYGACGIYMCKKWLKFENFYAWSINNGYSDELTIDRIKNEKGYFPSNCRWVTKSIQQLNKKKSFTKKQVISIRRELKNGDMIKDIAKRYGVGRHTIRTIKQNKTYTHF